MPRAQNEPRADAQGDQDGRQVVPGNWDAVEEAPERGDDHEHQHRDHDRRCRSDRRRRPSSAAACPRPRLRHAVLAVDGQRDREADQRRGDDGERDDRRHVVGGGLDPTELLDRLVAEDRRKDQQEDHRQQHREEHGCRVAPEDLLIEAELVRRQRAIALILRPPRSAPDRCPRGSAGATSSPSAHARARAPSR